MYMYIYIYIYVCIYDIYIYIYIYTIIIYYSNTVSVNLMLICTELSELIIYCKYAWKCSVFEVLY